MKWAGDVGDLHTDRPCTVAPLVGTSGTAALEDNQISIFQSIAFMVFIVNVYTKKIVNIVSDSPQPHFTDLVVFKLGCVRR